MSELSSAGSVSAIVVDHDAGDVLDRCVSSLLGEPVASVVVVENGEKGSRNRLALEQLGRVEVLRPGRNLGYGAGVNRGLARCSSEMVLVCNSDVVVDPGALSALVEAMRSDATIGICAPLVRDAAGNRYPSARRFPSVLDAAGHAIFSLFAPSNRFSRRYRMENTEQPRSPSGSGGSDNSTEPLEVDWVSGACFLARREALEELGGFDESFFMYCEDMDLCWRARQAGWGVLYVPSASVVHLQGVSTAKRPWLMLFEHHRSAIRFSYRQMGGWSRLGIVPVFGFFLVRLVVSAVLLALRRGGPGAGPDMH